MLGTHEPGSNYKFANYPTQSRHFAALNVSFASVRNCV